MLLAGLSSPSLDGFVPPRYSARIAVPLLPPLASDPLRRVRADFGVERAARAREGVPPGPTQPSARRTYGWVRNALPIMLEAYREYGPIFTIRIMHGLWVFMLGPEANHFVTAPTRTTSAGATGRWASSFHSSETGCSQRTERRINAHGAR